MATRSAWNKDEKLDDAEILEQAVQRSKLDQDYNDQENLQRALQWSRLEHLQEILVLVEQDALQRRLRLQQKKQESELEEGDLEMFEEVQNSDTVDTTIKKATRQRIALPPMPCYPAPRPPRSEVHASVEDVGISDPNPSKARLHVHTSTSGLRTPSTSPGSSGSRTPPSALSSPSIGSVASPVTVVGQAAHVFRSIDLLEQEFKTRLTFGTLH